MSNGSMHQITGSSIAVLERTTRMMDVPDYTERMADVVVEAITESSFQVGGKRPETYRAAGVISITDTKVEFYGYRVNRMKSEGRTYFVGYLS